MMYASFDRNSPATLPADILSLSWKGDARRGWLATGNAKKTVGVTYTEISDEDEFDIDPSQPLEQYFDTEQIWALEKQAMRRNFNFREHSQEVSRCGVDCLETIRDFSCVFVKLSLLVLPPVKALARDLRLALCGVTDLVLCASRSDSCPVIPVCEFLPEFSGLWGG